MKHFLAISALFLHLSTYAQIQTPAIVAVDTSAEITLAGLLFEESEGFSMMTRKNGYGIRYIRFDSTLQMLSDYYPYLSSSTTDGFRTQDGGFVISGLKSFVDYTRVPSILKLDSAGHTQWQNYGQYAGTTHYGAGSCQTSDGGFALVGKRGVVGLYESATLAKFDAQGTHLWEKEYISNEGSVHVSDVEQLPDGSLLLLANQGLPDTVSPSIWLIRVNNQGDSLSSFSLGKRYDKPSSLLVLPDGNSIVVTTENKSLPMEWFRQAIKVYKVTPDGQVLWENRYLYEDNDSSSLGGTAVRAHLTPDGGCIILGGIYGTEADTVGGHLYLLKLDASGNRQWETLLGTPDSDEAGDVLPLSKGGYVVSATTSELLSGSIYAYLALLSSDGTTAAETSVVPSLMEISPNPFADVLSITLERHFAQGLLELMDVQGRVLLQQNLAGHNNYTFDTRNLSAGVYLLRISDGTSQETRRVVKR